MHISVYAGTLLFIFVLIFDVIPPVNQAWKRALDVLRDQEELIQACDTDRGLSIVFTAQCHQIRSDQQSFNTLFLQQLRLGTYSRFYPRLLLALLLLLWKSIKRARLWIQCRIDLLKRRCKHQ